MAEQLNRQQRRKQEREFQSKRKSALSKRYSGTEVQKIVFQTMLDTFEASKAMHHEAMLQATKKVRGVGPERTRQLIEHFDEAFDESIQEEGEGVLERHNPGGIHEHLYVSDCGDVAGDGVRKAVYLPLVADSDGVVAVDGCIKKP